MTKPISEPRPISRLLELTKTALIDKHGSYSATSGLCMLAHIMHSNENIISVAERDIIQYYIKDNRPFRLSSVDTIRNWKSEWFWPKYKFMPRLEWLEKHIKLNK